MVYAYPWTGRPGEPLLVDDWDLIPGARGCTPETCGFRDHHAELLAAGAAVFGLSTQDTAYQRELAERLGCRSRSSPTRAWGSPRRCGCRPSTSPGETLLRRLTLLVRDGAIERVWYPVFPPDRHAGEVLAWLRANPAQS